MNVRFAALAVAAACAVTACTSGKPDPTPTPTPTTRSRPPTSSAPQPTSSSPTPREPLTTGPNVKPGEKPPVLAAAARAHTSVGAQYFAGYYFRAYDWGYATNDPYLVAAISEPGCTACKSYVDSLRKLRRAGGHVDGGRVSITAVQLIPSTGSKAEYAVRVTADEERIQLVYPHRVPKTVASPLHDFQSVVYTSWIGNGWRVIEVSN